jgi:adenylate cyclase, class 2
MTSDKHTETEVKVLVDDLAKLERLLQTLGATQTAARVYERNVRYEDATNSLSPSDRVLRLRTDSRVRLTYKEPLSVAQGDIYSRTELEVTISDFETMDLLLQRLGFHPAWIYDKYRTTYELTGCEVVLDELPFGQFVEIEGEADQIETVMGALGLNTARRIPASYSVLFFRLKEALHFPFRDLTFENFQGVELPRHLIDTL